MEDEEYYHMMVSDMERLHRTYHHINRSEEQLDAAAAELPRFNTSMSSAAGRIHNPLMSGIQLAISGAAKASLNAALERVAEARRKLFAVHH
ncbi:hypothetical protein B0T19DRAFT_84140 [Cercophora scortea]|uniref:Uncharacterized protein n=1 Tax=Cercophora scortea TaxID=314031 RepID=A0AAE0MH86_9PEZI|nr:hypothetical protein B0T19DRAFT_84140 [Cercophora scortea]